MSSEGSPVDTSSLVTRHSSLFPEPERAAAMLDAIARQFPDPVQAQQSVDLLLESLPRSPDPEMALANLAHWASRLTAPSATFATLKADPRLLDDLLCLFGSSQYLADSVIRNSTAYSLLLEPDESWRRENLRDRIAGVAAPFVRPESRLEALRRARRREFLRIGWRDLAGRAGFDEVVTKISELAEALIEQTLATVRATLAERQPEIDAQVRFSVIAMGKLGGSELNYSSDVDLLFLFDSPTPDDATHLRYATKLAEALFGALSATTAEGTLFRVDMRLRPEGRFGALVRTLASYREYYDRWMETWERQALIKARPVAGDPDLGRRFAALAEERAYPAVHAATLFEDVRDVRSAIERRVERRDQSETNVKEGRGTIREIEFTVQLLQLIFGASRPELRTGNTPQALAALASAGLLAGDERTRFEEHYRFFRTVEHRLQLMDDLPVRLLPDDPSELRKLGRRMGRSPADADRFIDEYRARADDVERLSRDILDRLTADGVTAADPLRLMILALAPGSGIQDRHGPTAEPLNPELADRLAADGFRHPEATIARLRSLATGAPRFSLPISTTRLFADLASSLLPAAAGAPDPDGAMAAVAEVAERLGAHRTLYQTLSSQPDMLRVLCEIVGFSPVVRELVLRSPELLDVLYDQPTRETPPTSEAMREDLAGRLQRALSPSDRLTALRRFQKRELLRIIARDLLLRVDAQTTVGELSDLADVSVVGALTEAGRTASPIGRSSTPNTEHPTPFPPGFAVLALGRLGGREMHYLSDLDLLYVYDPPPGSGATHQAYEAVAGSLTRALQEWLREGQLYPVDLRLRPEGKSGFMVVHLEAARRYYLGGRALTWERQALTRLRPVAGDPGVAARFVEVAHQFVYGSPFAPESDAELRAMKGRIERERVAREERDRHLKLGPGGLSDIEFLVQRLQLIHGAAYPALRVTGTLQALQASVGHGLLPADAAGDLQAGFLFLTRLRQHLRLRAIGAPTDLLPAEPEEREILARSLDLTAPELTDRYLATTTRVRDLFTQYFLGH